MNYECIKTYAFSLDRDANIDEFLANGGLQRRNKILDEIGTTLNGISRALGSKRRAAVINMPQPLNTSADLHAAVVAEMNKTPGLSYRDAYRRIQRSKMKGNRYHTARPGDEIHNLIVRAMDQDPNLNYASAFQVVMSNDPQLLIQYNADAIKPKVTTMTYGNFQADEAGAAIDHEARLLMQQNPQLRYAQAVKAVIRANPSLARDYGEAAIARESK